MSIYGGIISVGGGGGGGGPAANWEAVTNVGGEALLTGTQFVRVTNSDATAQGFQLKEATGQLGTNPMVRFLDQASGENAWLKVGGQHSVGFGFEAARGAVTNPGVLQKITALGYRAGRAMTVGNSDGTFLGYDAGVLATGIDNTFVGARAGDAVTTGTRSVLIGDDAGGAQTTGGENVAIGSQAGAAVTIATSNVFIGTDAGRLVNAANNVFVGQRAGYSTAATGTTDNIFIGYEAGYSTTTGASNVYIGSGAGALATSAGENVHVGYGAGNNSAAVGNTFVGFLAGANATTALSCVFVGRSAGLAVTTGGSNTFVGHEAGKVNTTATSNTFIGASSGIAVTTGIDNTFVGASSGAANTTGASNVFIGYSAGGAALGPAHDVYIGHRAGESGTSACVDNVLIGYLAGMAHTTAANNTFVGASCGTAATSGGSNTALGSNALLSLTTGTVNTAIGRAAGQALINGNYNVFLGQSVFLSGTSASMNVGIGFAAGSSATTAQNNILIGYQAGDNLTTGGTNIVIGYNIDAPTATSANLMTIGNLIFGTAIDGTGTTLSTGNIGIGIVTPLYKLDVAGTGRFAVPDNTADAFNIIEGANTYIALSTSNTTETMQFGNATTNPAFNFAGSGLVDFDGGFKMAATKEADFYNTASESVNYERGFLRWTGNIWQLGAEAAGTGVQRALRLMYGASVMMDGSAARPSFPNGITFTGDSLFTNNIALNFGNIYSSIMWGTAQTNAGLMIGIVCGAADGSGNIIISEYADRGVNFLHAANADPHLFLHSADAVTTTDWLGAWCDQSGDGHLEVGGNGLIVGTSGKKLGFYGTAPAVRSTGWNVTGQPVNTIGGLIDYLLTIGLLSA